MILNDKRLYNIWACMKQRCLNPNHTASPWYHDKGISVCAAWLDFKGFEEWALSNGYEDGLSIDRIDPDKNYEPQNCRWIPLQENRQRAKFTGCKKSGTRGKGKFMVVRPSKGLPLRATVIKTGLSKHCALELAKKLTESIPFSCRIFYDVKVTDGHKEGERVRWECLRNYLTEPKR